MKHSVKITLILIAMFLIAQVVGLFIVELNVKDRQVDETGDVVIEYDELPFNMERPEIEGDFSYIYIMIGVLIGTLLALLLVKFRARRMWKLWYFFVVVLCLGIAFNKLIELILGKFIVKASLFIPYLSVASVALTLAVVFAFFKVIRPNLYICNISEVFIYGGLAAIFVPVISLKAAFIILLIISIYDMYAVWKSKHMIKLAMFQRDAKVFAGLAVPYHRPKIPRKRTLPVKKIKVRTAILGGGDIGFPLMFAGVVMKQTGFLTALIIPAVTAIALFMLFYYGQKEKFYPAMPFLSIGCIAGYLITLLI